MTREIANWFHEREEELFTVDETPFTREEIVQVVNDSVDPIQQVMVDGEKYIGVISYDEHDGWYEYTRWDDSVGEVTMGVCAKCVEEAEYVDEVSRTIGDSTDVAREKFDHHYEQDHEIRPDEVNTGATLLSGTTINSNEAIHPGMDGSGSGVDADFVLGNEALQTGIFYTIAEDTTAGTVLTKFTTPCGGRGGIGLDSNDCIWHADLLADSIYKLDRGGSVLTKFATTTQKSPNGLGVDSNDSLWNSDRGNNSIYQINQSGSVITTFVSPSSDLTGVGIDSNDSIWNSSSPASGGSIYKINQTGTIQTQFSSPSSNPRGLGIDSLDSIWSAGYYAGIAQLNTNGSVLSKFDNPAEGNQPRGLGLDSSDSIWFTDSSDESIFKLEKETKIVFG